MLHNHPELHIDANATLATARLVTGLTTDGNVIPIFGFFTYIARFDQIAVLRIAQIDVASARLTWAPRGQTRSNHRLDRDWDDADFLPDWDTVLRHTKVAHKACANFVFVGWDAAFTEDGPVLLEGNLNWCADDYQRLSGEPLGNTKFAQILEPRLRTLKLDPFSSRRVRSH